MPIYNRIAEFQDDLIATRRDIHENPELGFEENRTSDLVAKQLESWGIEVHRDIAKTGLVGVLKGNGDSSRTIGIRADMDALPMSEEGTPIYKSKNDGKMHACGHDGHTTMLLGAARYLAETRNFDGTVNFIFQPAEEGGGGGRVMVEEGVFEKFPCDTVWGMHNDPKLPAGTLATRPGPLMAAVDTVKITINAVGCHAALPHVGIDPIAVAVQLYTAATINHPKEAAEAIDIAREIVDESMIDDNIAPVMGGEDFSYMLEARPGAFLWIGGGKTDNDPGLHHPEYDFNDEVLTLGSSYWAKLVETRLAKTN